MIIDSNDTWDLKLNCELKLNPTVLNLEEGPSYHVSAISFHKTLTMVK